MSQENVELARRAYKALNRTDSPGRWRFGLKHYPTLSRGALDALENLMGPVS